MELKDGICETCGMLVKVNWVFFKVLLSRAWSMHEQIQLSFSIFADKRRRKLLLLPSSSYSSLYITGRIVKGKTSERHKQSSLKSNTYTAAIRVCVCPVEWATVDAAE